MIKHVISCFGYNTCLIFGLVGMILSGYGVKKLKCAGIVAIGVYLICLILLECL